MILSCLKNFDFIYDHHCYICIYILYLNNVIDNIYKNICLSVVIITNVPV